MNDGRTMDYGVRFVRGPFHNRIVWLPRLAPVRLRLWRPAYIPQRGAFAVLCELRYSPEAEPFSRLAVRQVRGPARFANDGLPDYVYLAKRLEMGPRRTRFVEYWQDLAPAEGVWDTLPIQLDNDKEWYDSTS